MLRPFTRWLRQFEPRTEVPDESVFGPVPGRVAPHVYREEEIVSCWRPRELCTREAACAQ